MQAGVHIPPSLVIPQPPALPGPGLGLRLLEAGKVWESKVE